MSDYRILIVDDDEGIHDALKTILTPHHHSLLSFESEAADLFGNGTLSDDTSTNTFSNYRIDSAYQGLEAIKMIQQAVIDNAPYAVVFMDVRMPPGIDGVQTIKKIWGIGDKLDVIDPNVEIIMCTAYSDYRPEDLQKELGESERLLYTQKPFSPASITQTVISLTKKWQLLRENKSYQQSLEEKVKKRTEALDKALQAAIDANKARSVFLANMSHELRTPLNGIIGNAELLEESKIGHEQKELALSIKNCGISLLDLINNILDIATIETSSITFDEVVFNLENVIHEACDIAKSEVDNTKIDLLVDDETQAIVVGDPTRLRQVIINLLLNAVKFTEEGSITIGVKSLEESLSHQCLEISVTDTGIGMSQEETSKIFQSFSQVDNSASRKYGGAGLGLTISQKILEILGSELNVSSMKGKGTTFSFQIKLPKGVIPENRITTLNDIDTLKGMTCLVIDDNKPSVSIIINMLRKWGIKTIGVYSAEEALIIAKKYHFDFAFIDIRMPRVDGYECLAKLRALSEFNTQTIAITSDRKECTLKQIKESGFDSYRYKPLKPNDTAQLLLNLTAKKQEPFIESNNDNHLLSEFIGNSFTILVVEDNITNQKIIEKILKKMGHSVLLANNGLEGVNLFRRKNFDLVFMDIQMPVMDGVTATKHIRELGQVPVIALTANTTTEDKRKYFEIGMNDVIAKPFSRKIIMEAIHKAIVFS